MVVIDFHTMGIERLYKAAIRHRTYHRPWEQCKTLLSDFSYAQSFFLSQLHLQNRVRCTEVSSKPSTKVNIYPLWNSVGIKTSSYMVLVRHSKGLKPLCLSEKLNKAALKHSEWMGKHGKLIHGGDGDLKVRYPS